jgi:hypothetical protein
MTRFAPLSQRMTATTHHTASRGPGILQQPTGPFDLMGPPVSTPPAVHLSLMREMVYIVSAGRESIEFTARGGSTHDGVCHRTLRDAESCVARGIRVEDGGLGRETRRQVSDPRRRDGTAGGRRSAAWRGRRPGIPLHATREGLVQRPGVRAVDRAPPDGVRPGFHPGRGRVGRVRRSGGGCGQWCGLWDRDRWGRGSYERRRLGCL